MPRYKIQLKHRCLWIKVIYKYNLLKKSLKDIYIYFTQIMILWNHKNDNISFLFSVERWRLPEPGEQPHKPLPPGFGDKASQVVNLTSGNARGRTPGQKTFFLCKTF